ncbi:MAG: hypothetical protein ACR5K6_04755 [Wolbachia sp.]
MLYTKITYEGGEICELDPVFVAYNSESFYEYKPSRPGNYIAIEKKDNELSAYFADSHGNPIDMLEEHAIGINSIYKKNFNTHLRSELLKHSDIRKILPELREVLPEVNVDNSLYSDTGQLGCWINKTSTIQKIATDESFKNSVKDLLKSDPEFISNVKEDKGDKGEQGPPGRKGEDANPEEVVRNWANDSSKRYMISQEIVNSENFQRAVKYLLKQDSKFKSGMGDVLKSDEGFRDSIKGDPGKDGESPSANAVAAQLMSNDNRNTLVTKVASNEDLQEAIAGSQVLRATIASLTKANNEQQNFTLQKGEKLLDDVYEANIVSNNKTMATLQK